MNTARRVATAVAVILGVAGGITTARIAPGTTAGLAPTTEINDPLQLGIALISQRCNDKAVLVIGGGGTPTGLGAIVSDNLELDLRYLRTDESCETKWSNEKDTPEYVIYGGPFDTQLDPCRVRMESEDPSIQVTQLVDGSEQWVNCGCVLPTDELQGVVPPDLIDEANPQANVVTVQLMQEMLNDIDEAAGDPTRPVSGRYDPPTLQRVLALQTAEQILPPEGGPPDGGVGERTWKALRESACGLYENDQDG